MGKKDKEKEMEEKIRRLEEKIKKLEKGGPEEETTAGEIL